MQVTKIVNCIFKVDNRSRNKYFYYLYNGKIYLL